MGWYDILNGGFIVPRLDDRLWKLDNPKSIIHNPKQGDDEDD